MIALSLSFQVFALDKDLGPNADLEYSIMDGPDDFKPTDFFAIDLKTGTISVAHDILGLRKCFLSLGSLVHLKS